MQIYMYVHTRERDSRPGFDGVKIKVIIITNIAEKPYYQCELHKHKGNLQNTWKVLKAIHKKERIS